MRGPLTTAAASAGLPALFKEIETVWDEIGLTSDDASERSGEIAGHLKTLLTNVLAQEVEYRDEVKDNVTSLQERLTQLCAELGSPLPSAYQESFNVVLADAEELLEDAVNACNEDRESRLLGKIELESQLCRLEELLAIPAVESDDSLSVHAISKLEARVSQLTDQLTTKRDDVRPTVERVALMLTELGSKPDDKFARMIASGIDSFVHTTENLRKLKALGESLEERYTAAQEQAETLRAQLAVRWEQLNVPHVERESFSEAHQGCRATTIAALETELKTLTETRERKMGQLITSAQAKVRNVTRFFLPNPKLFVHNSSNIFRIETCAQPSKHETYPRLSIL